MNNPLEILTTLDRHLHNPAELTLFGPAALALGYPNPAPGYGATHDVDGIIPVTTEEPDVDFWLAQQATNTELKNRGLYITHRHVPRPLPLRLCRPSRGFRGNVPTNRQ